MEENPQQKQLEKEVEKIEHNITERYDTILLNQLEAAKAELDELYNYITQGSILRSKVRWFEHGENPQKYFFGLEKRNKRFKMSLYVHQSVIENRKRLFRISF